jgi:hypothetical protein
MALQAVHRAEAGSNRGLDVTFGYDNSPNDITQQNSMVHGGSGLSRDHSSADRG